MPISTPPLPDGMSWLSTKEAAAIPLRACCPRDNARKRHAPSPLAGTMWHAGRSGSAGPRRSERQQPCVSSEINRNLHILLGKLKVVALQVGARPGNVCMEWACSDHPAAGPLAWL